MNIQELVNSMRADGYFSDLATDRAAQFGTRTRRYIGAELLPERTVRLNAFREGSIKWRPILAGASTRFSPPTLKGGAISETMLIELAEADIEREMTGEDYDALLAYLGSSSTMQAMASITNFVDTTINLAMAELNELWRWQAIVDAEVDLRGVNGYREAVPYPDPAGHRFAATVQWSDDANDPMEDIHAAAELLTDKGLQPARIIASRDVVSILTKNAKVKARAGVAVISSTGQIQGAIGRATLDTLNAIMAQDSLPNIETYDLQWRTQDGSGYFLPRGTFVMIASSGRDETLDLADAEPIVLRDTLGYTAIGRAAGQSAPGKVIHVEQYNDKPPRIKAQGWETVLPVILEPDAIAVVHTIS